ncbi:Hydantoinase B/oxoprolinase [compost metagenome]
MTFWKKEIRQGSGGAGEWRGGDGVDMLIENVSGSAITLLAAFDRIDYPPRGIDGGAAGAAGYVGLSDGTPMLGKGAQQIQPRQTLVIRTPGGGGLGTPPG